MVNRLKTFLFTLATNERDVHTVRAAHRFKAQLIRLPHETKTVHDTTVSSARLRGGL